eukprot:TRINITY_DN3459_c0_g1_i2.p1 TRINITY_DN3459_c0_g1~~TRINITY_DN3459_c0_g1_i2.p1  ORF type:complete len:744 (-),score=154.60 TRINITY_DN3459_c0_g1_i2:409-2562(-)
MASQTSKAGCTLIVTPKDGAPLPPAWKKKTTLQGPFGDFGEILRIEFENQAGCASIQYDDPRDAADAAKAMNKKNICGVEVTVELANQVTRGAGRESVLVTGGVNIEQKVAELALRHVLDEPAVAHMINVFQHRQRLGCDLKKDFAEWDTHLAASNKPSALVSMKLAELRSGQPIGPCRFRKAPQQSRPLPDVHLEGKDAQGGFPLYRSSDYFGEVAEDAQSTRSERTSAADLGAGAAVAPSQKPRQAEVVILPWPRAAQPPPDERQRSRSTTEQTHQADVAKGGAALGPRDGQATPDEPHRRSRTERATHGEERRSDRDEERPHEKEYRSRADRTTTGEEYRSRAERTAPGEERRWDRNEERPLEKDRRSRRRRCEYDSPDGRDGQRAPEDYGHQSHEDTQPARKPKRKQKLESPERSPSCVRQRYVSPVRQKPEDTKTKRSDSLDSRDRNLDAQDRSAIKSSGASRGIPQERQAHRTKVKDGLDSRDRSNEAEVEQPRQQRRPRQPRQSREDHSDEAEVEQPRQQRRPRQPRQSREDHSDEAEVEQPRQHRRPRQPRQPREDDRSSEAELVQPRQQRRHRQSRLPREEDERDRSLSCGKQQLSPDRGGQQDFNPPARRRRRREKIDSVDENPKEQLDSSDHGKQQSNRRNTSSRAAEEEEQSADEEREQGRRRKRTSRREQTEDEPAVASSKPASSRRKTRRLASRDRSQSFEIP